VAGPRQRILTRSFRTSNVRGRDATNVSTYAIRLAIR
jgi:hypothetical protein